MVTCKTHIVLAPASYAVVQMRLWTPSDTAIAKADRSRSKPKAASRRSASSTADVGPKTTFPPSVYLGGVVKRPAGVDVVKSGASLAGNRLAGGERSNLRVPLPSPARVKVSSSQLGTGVFNLSMTVGPRTSGRDILDWMKPVTSQEQRKQLEDAIGRADAGQVRVKKAVCKGGFMHLKFFFAS